jgi:ADP-ribosyl-[dinitrogen reductase] hydrolase
MAPCSPARTSYTGCPGTRRYSAVQLGGDPDTVAALVGGLMGSKLTAEQVRAELPWHRLVALPEPESAIAETAAALATTRAFQSA